MVPEEVEDEEEEGEAEGAIYDGGDSASFVDAGAIYDGGDGS